MKLNIVLALLCASLMLIGCASQQPQSEKPVAPATGGDQPAVPPAPVTETPDASETVIPPVNTTPDITETPPTPPAPTVVLGALTDCSFLTLADVTTVVGVAMKDAAIYPYPASCSRSWIDTRTSMDATVALQVTKQSPEATTDDLKGAAGTAVDKVGDYDTKWDANGEALNFGKGEYKFQVQCMFEQCSKEKAIALANIVLTRTP